MNARDEAHAAIVRHLNDEHWHRTGTEPDMNQRREHGVQARRMMNVLGVLPLRHQLAILGITAEDAA